MTFQLFFEHFCMVYIKKSMTVLYLLDLCVAGGDTSFAPQANLVFERSLEEYKCLARCHVIHAWSYYFFFQFRDNLLMTFLIYHIIWCFKRPIIYYNRSFFISLDYCLYNYVFIKKNREVHFY